MSWQMLSILLLLLMLLLYPRIRIFLSALLKSALALVLSYLLSVMRFALQSLRLPHFLCFPQFLITFAEQLHLANSSGCSN